MTSARTLWITIWATILLGVTILLVYFFSQHEPDSKNGIQNATAIIALITTTAIGIERTIETVWVIMGGIWGTYFPLNIINKQVQTLTDELNASLTSSYDAVVTELENLKSVAGKTTAEIAEIDKAIAEIGTLKAKVSEFANLAPGNQRVQLLAAAAAQNVKYIEEKYGNLSGKISNAVAVANSSIDGLQNFLATFKDNPGRRLISIYLGAILGLICAGFFELNVILATLGNAEHYRLGIILTGLIIGLGSNPTHEVIRLLQEYKENSKGKNTKLPDLP